MVLGVQLGGVVRVILRVQSVGVSDLRVVRRSFVASAVGVLAGHGMVLGGFLVVFCGLGVVVGDRVGGRGSLLVRAVLCPRADGSTNAVPAQYGRPL